VIARLTRVLASRYPAGVDVSRALRLPRWVDAALSHDAVAYPLHAGLGRALNIVEAPPEIAVVEWLKAAAHARSERALLRVVHGLTTSQRRAAGRGADFEQQIAAALIRRVTCTGADVTMRGRQILALDRAGLTIPDAQARSDTGGARFVCLLHPDGGCPTIPPVLHRDAARP
jgi:hypothetical protein